MTTDARAIVEDEEGHTGRCWCNGRRDNWFSEDYLDPDCGGMGVLHCYCGGDQCVCHWHGEVACFGCPDCEETEDEYGDD